MKVRTEERGADLMSLAVMGPFVVVAGTGKGGLGADVIVAGGGAACDTLSAALVEAMGVS